jgi:hypothetical protein
MGNGGYFAGVKRSGHEDDNLPPSSAILYNASRFTSRISHSYSFLTCRERLLLFYFHLCIVNHGKVSEGSVTFVLSVKEEDERHEDLKKLW